MSAPSSRFVSILFWVVVAFQPTSVFVSSLSFESVSTVGTLTRGKTKRRPLSTKTVLWSPELEQLQSNDQFQFLRYSRGLSPLNGRVAAGISRNTFNGSPNTKNKQERDSLPIMRATANSLSQALHRLSAPQTRSWTASLLVLAAVVSVYCLVPIQSVSALEGAVATSATSSLLLQESAAAASSLAAASAPTTAAHLGQTAVAAAAAAAGPTINPISMAFQLRLTLRMVYAALLGAVVGKESTGGKTQYSRPAGGVRTMALVSLGAATFTLCSMYGFGSVGASRYDPSRMAANVSSGVGFIGAGVITTTAGQSNNNCGAIVHGLTTAAAIWLSAAVGVGCGVGMCVLSTAAAMLTIAVLKIGERQQKVEEAKRKLTEQHANSQRAYEDQLLLKELRRHSATSSSFQKEIEESIKFQKLNESVGNSFQFPIDPVESTGSI